MSRLVFDAIRVHAALWLKPARQAERQGRLVSIERLEEATQGLLRFRQTADARLPYFDTLYFFGANIDQLLFFLRWQQYPDGCIRFVEERHHELDHLLYEVGVDS